MLRFLLWRLLGLLAVLAGLALIAWFIDGGPGKALRGHASAGAPHLAVPALGGILNREARAIWSWTPALGVAPTRLLLALVVAPAFVVAIARVRARHRRRYVRLRVEAYRADQASAEAVATMFGALHKRVLRRWWRRLVLGQPSLALEVHHTGGLPHSVWLAVTCPQGQERMVEAALQATYPNCRLCPAGLPVGVPPAVLRLKKHAEFIKRVKTPERFERDREPPVNRLLTVMGACGEPAFVQMALTPTPALFEAFAKHLYKRHEARLSRERREHLLVRDRSMVEDAELRGGLEVQHRPLFFVDLRVIAPNRAVCERIASELRAEGAENRLVERGTALRHGLLGLYGRRVAARRGQSAAVVSQGGLGVGGAGVHLAAAVGRLPDGSVRADRLAARAGAARHLATGGRPGHAARCPRGGLDPCGAAQAEHRGAGNGRAGQVQLPRGHRRRGPSPGALRGDRARSQGRRRGGRGEPRAGRADVHAAGLRAPDLRLQSAGGGRPG